MNIHEAGCCARVAIYWDCRHFFSNSLSPPLPPVVVVVCCCYGDGLSLRWMKLTMKDSLPLSYPGRKEGNDWRWADLISMNIGASLG